MADKPKQKDLLAENKRLGDRNKMLHARCAQLQSYAEWCLWNVEWISKLAENDPERALKALAGFKATADAEFKRDSLRTVPEAIAEQWGDARPFRYFEDT
jgi:hypothetical protein